MSCTVRLHKGSQFGPIHVALACHPNGEAWAVLSNQKTALKTLQEYSFRFNIEEMFRDFKHGGYCLEGCRASNQRFMAIVLLIAIAYLCAARQGRRLKQRALQKYIARPETGDRPYRRHSFFHIGLAAHRWVPF